MGENVKHFSLEEKNDNTYGWPWNEVVKTFLQSHYNDEEKQCSIKIRNKEYKILKRESVTVFYDADGNTLFDVTNGKSAMAIFTSRRENRKVEIVLWFGMMWFTNGQKIISIWMIKPLKKRKRKRKKSGERVRSKKLRNASNRTPNRSLAKKRHRKRHRMRNR